VDRQRAVEVGVRLVGTAPNLLFVHVRDDIGTAGAAKLRRHRFLSRDLAEPYNRPIPK
jgi:hypothetical protein